MAKDKFVIVITGKKNSANRLYFSSTESWTKNVDEAMTFTTFNKATAKMSDVFVGKDVEQYFSELYQGNLENCHLIPMISRP